MKSRRIRSFLLVLVLLAMTSQLVFAEDGIIFRRNISKTPDAETEKAAIFMMDFYVPAQASTGLVGPVVYPLLVDETTVAYEDRAYAKPLFTVYIDDIGAMEEELAEGMSGIMGGISFGHFDAFAAYSMDDGTSWKSVNLSNSQDLSSFTLEDGHEYPGDVHNVVHQVFNDNIFVAWASKYCEGGAPLYSIDPVEDAEYLADLEDNHGKDALYLYDFFGVGGNQGSVDYAEQGYPEIGEIPYSCVWTARGKLLAGDDPATAEIEATYVIWTKPERLTSGKRDVNLPVVDCAKDAGCMLTWQEDPEGLRPGQGLGPGEGWSGAIANAQTDIWYSHISFADFDLVFGDPAALTAGDVVTMAAYTGDTMPKAYVPMAIPVRLTDNAKCKGVSTELQPSDPYCYIDFDSIDDIDYTNVQGLLDLTEAEADADFCASTIDWTTPGGSTQPVCVTEDGRVLNGRVAATRVRMNLKPYTKTDGTKGAWIVMAAEETKALGDVLIDPYGVPTEDPIDIGKDVWFYSFDPFKTGTDVVMIDQGGMINQPAACSPWTVGATYDCTESELFPVQIDPLNGGEYYLTEIARRFALTTNSVADAVASESGLSAMLIYKQGIINQGGPADIFLRRVIIPDDFDSTVDNPYAFENMECAEWKYTDGSNPNYLKGLCMSPAINISGNTIVECSGATGNDACAATFPVADDGSIPDDVGSFPKVLEWRQCDGLSAIEGCEDDNDLDDQSWENPFDIAKGHRGFLDKDYVMMMYAWSPNWKANTIGNDHYNLYVRRSFDGGLTWTTTPADLGGTGTSAVENYCVSTSSDECVGTEFIYGAGEFEQGRNVSQLIGNKVTILDPRYSPTGGMKLYPTIGTKWLEDNISTPSETLPYDDDLARDRSKFFMIYETGDNTTVTEGEAVPLDLFYSRATVWGDIWELDPDYIDETTGEVLDYRWPWAEKDHEILSGEASMLANPGGTFMYAVWNQWEEEILPDGHELVFNSDMIYRRFMYLPDDTMLELAPTASILFVSATTVEQLAGDVLTLTGSARDLDKIGEGIVAYKWTSDLDGVVGNEQVLRKAAADLSRGRHTFTFSALDGEGHWSRSVSVTVTVVEQIYRVMLPMVMRSQ